MTDYAYVFDTETTGIVEPQIIQAASVAIDLDGRDQLGAVAHSYMPSKPIELGAMATHKITPESLGGCPPHTDFRFDEYVPGDYMIGHNVDFDWKAAGSPMVHRICTLAIARTLWPQLDSHRQEALAYFAWGNAATARLQNAHSALADVGVLCDLWRDLFLPMIRKALPGELAWDRIWMFSEDCRIPRIMTFGKHKGLPIGKVPLSYIKWYTGTPDQDPYLVEAFRRAYPGRV